MLRNKGCSTSPHVKVPEMDIFLFFVHFGNLRVSQMSIAIWEIEVPMLRCLKWTLFCFLYISVTLIWGPQGSQMDRP